MIQKKEETFNINLADEYFLLYPKALNITSNKKLYSFCHASTDVHKQNLRRKKKQIKEKKNVSNNKGEKSRVGGVHGQASANRPNSGDDSIPKKLTEEYIENLIREGLDDNPGNVQLIGKAVDFFVKVKTDKREGTKQMLNMDGFLQLAEDKLDKN